MSQQRRDPEVRAGGLKLLKLYVYCVLLSILAAAFATLPYWVPEVVSFWWAS
jgi:hypothetical protein